MCAAWNSASIMSYQNLLASDDKRLGRRITEAEEGTEMERIAGRN